MSDYIIHICFDGSLRCDNKGQILAYGSIIHKETTAGHTELIRNHSKSIPKYKVDSQTAEWMGLLTGLIAYKQLSEHPKLVIIQGDCKSIIDRLNNKSDSNAISHKYQYYYTACGELLASLGSKYLIVWGRRKTNQQADKCARDGGKLKINKSINRMPDPLLGLVQPECMSEDWELMV